MSCFENVKKNFGFGCMRLPMKGEAVDNSEFCRMADEFIAAGFNYFDTAHGYLDGKSEVAVRECVVNRYPRDAFVLADKLTGNYFRDESEVRPFFESQLEIMGVDYFDFYLMHAQNRERYEHFKRCRAYEQAIQLRSEGKIRHLGVSFHDKAEVLETILTEYPQLEFVQIQLNYIDYDDPAVQSRRCAEVCRRHGKPMIIMEPVKGGNLVNLPDDAKAVFDALGNSDYASYALRFAAGEEGVFMVLSGMSNLEQTRSNIASMKDFKPLDVREREAVSKVCGIFRSENLIQCTACRYCIAGCPKKIQIPDLFSCLNAKVIFHAWNADSYYGVHTAHGGKASDCIKCGKCEKVCPQNLPIRSLLEQVAKTFEKEKENA